MPTTVRSFAKINLGLAIGGVRSDAFHELVTLYHTVAAHDLVTVAAERGASRIEITCDDARVPLDARNTVAKMLERALALPPYASSSWSVAVEIEKRLPVQGGLGAGSGNAAAALLGLERETGLSLPGAERLRIAEQVGSDVPLFFVGGAVLGLGRGEQVYPMPDLVPEVSIDAAGAPAKHVEVVLAMPEVGVSTPDAFREWDRLAAAGLTGQGGSGRLVVLSRALAAALCEPQTSSGVSSAHERKDLARHPLAALVRTGIRNDFEEVVFRLRPLLGTIKLALLGVDLGSVGEAAMVSSSPRALYAALSGSGSALFGLYGSGKDAAAAELRLAACDVRSMRTDLLGREGFRRETFVEGAAGTV